MNSPAPDTREGLAIALAYQPLHKYLKNRFADTVVLTLAEIEDLIGFALPIVARERADWWADADGRGVPSAQARSWTQAHRVATPNLQARKVTFERSAP